MYSDVYCNLDENVAIRHILHGSWEALSLKWSLDVKPVTLQDCCCVCAVKQQHSLSKPPDFSTEALCQAVTLPYAGAAYHPK